MCGSSNGATISTPDGLPPINDGIVYVHTPAGVEQGNWYGDTVTTPYGTYYPTPDNS